MLKLHTSIIIIGVLHLIVGGLERLFECRDSSVVHNRWVCCVPYLNGAREEGLLVCVREKGRMKCSVLVRVDGVR